MNIEKVYFRGKPLHHHRSARKMEYNDETTLSDIFVVEYEDFRNMTASQVGKVFRHRHILVLHWPQEDEGFSLDTAEKFISSDQIVDLHGEFRVFI